jgi:hypothetical protein
VVRFPCHPYSHGSIAQWNAVRNCRQDAGDPHDPPSVGYLQTGQINAAEKKSASHDSNALFRTRVEPLEEFHRPVAAVLIAFALVRVKYILVVYHVTKVEILEFGSKLLDTATTITATK